MQISFADGLVLIFIICFRLRFLLITNEFYLLIHQKSLHLDHDEASHIPLMLIRVKVVEKLKFQKGKIALNKGLVNKLALSQSNTMEAKFAQLEATFMSMATQVKSNASKSKRRIIEKTPCFQVYMLTQDIFAKPKFYIQWPQTKSCWVFQEAMIMGTNLRFPK